MITLRKCEFCQENLADGAFFMGLRICADCRRPAEAYCMFAPVGFTDEELKTRSDEYQDLMRRAREIRREKSLQHIS